MAIARPRLQAKLYWPSGFSGNLLTLHTMSFPQRASFGLYLVFKHNKLWNVYFKTPTGGQTVTTKSINVSPNCQRKGIIDSRKAVVKSLWHPIPEILNLDPNWYNCEEVVIRLKIYWNCRNDCENAFLFQAGPLHLHVLRTGSPSWWPCYLKLHFEKGKLGHRWYFEKAKWWDQSYFRGEITDTTSAINYRKAIWKRDNLCNMVHGNPQILAHHLHNVPLCPPFPKKLNL